MAEYADQELQPAVEEDFDEDEEKDELDDEDFEHPDSDSDLALLAKNPAALQEQMDFEVCPVSFS